MTGKCAVVARTSYTAPDYKPEQFRHQQQDLIAGHSPQFHALPDWFETHLSHKDGSVIHALVYTPDCFCSYGRYYIELHRCYINRRSPYTGQVCLFQGVKIASDHSTTPYCALPGNRDGDADCEFVSVQESIFGSESPRKDPGDVPDILTIHELHKRRRAHHESTAKCKVLRASRASQRGRKLTLET